ncbi:DUF3558 domain-containing protein [Amycolatopsis sp. NBC_01488]|uniref:DUF3558 domain-containing protein n=1 Tax=Amycolatopsis sp. NBC_01488 TaxID=2903563 RepID=UPI002E2845B7|nr:DUF3558 domain-containing protein [Amycolatopsis sp. NBC_01488]
MEVAVRGFSVVLAVGVVIAAVAGCSSPPAAPQRLSPSIPGDPLDLTGFVAQPCGLVNAQQLARYYIAAPATTKLPWCVWVPADTTGLTYQASVDTSSGGLESLYEHRTTVGGFDPADVHSYPAIHRDARGGHCTVQVGVADDTLLSVTIDATNPKLSVHQDPCAEADRFAGSIIGYQGHRAP